ncbi:MAG: hypothetical protein U0872_16425 [Planctomycetaceae bacterium]
MRFAALAIIAMLLFAAGCVKSTAISHRSETSELTQDNQVRWKGLSDGRYSFAFTEGDQVRASGSFRTMEYRWNGVLVSISEGELRVDNEVIMEIKDKDLITFDESGTLLVNNELVGTFPSN